MTNNKNFKIGDIVEFGKEPNAPIPSIEGAGEILALARDLPIISSWIVLITRRDTEFLKNRPEKALIILDSQMKHVEIKKHKCYDDSPCTHDKNCCDMACPEHVD